MKLFVHANGEHMSLDSHNELSTALDMSKDMHDFIKIVLLQLLGRRVSDLKMDQKLPCRRRIVDRVHER